MKQWVLNNESSHCTMPVKQDVATFQHSSYNTELGCNAPCSVTETNNGNLYIEPGLNLSIGLHDLDICQNNREKSRLSSSGTERNDKRKDRADPFSLKSYTSETVYSNHMRSLSCKAGPNSRRPQELDFEQTLPRPRTYSMPTRNTFQRPKLNKNRANYDDVTYYHVRTFSTSANRIVRRGNSIKRHGSNKQLNSSASQASTGSRQSILSEVEIPVYKVLVVGSQSVGKTSLIQQFISHDHMASLNTSLDGEWLILCY